MAVKRVVLELSDELHREFKAAVGTTESQSMRGILTELLLSWLKRKKKKEATHEK